MTGRTPAAYRPRLEVTPIDQAPTSFTKDGHDRIRIAGRLDATRSGRIEGLAMIAESSVGGRPTTLLEGVVADRAALHGILDRFRDLDRQRLTVQRVERS